MAIFLFRVVRKSRRELFDFYLPASRSRFETRRRFVTQSVDFITRDSFFARFLSPNRALGYESIREAFASLAGGIIRARVYLDMSYPGTWVRRKVK